MDASIDVQVRVQCAGARINHLIDDKDWSTLRQLCADSVALRVRGPGEDIAASLDRASFVDQLAAVNGPDRLSFHSHSDVVVRRDEAGATLVAHSYGWNHCATFDPPLYEVWGRMTYRFQADGDEWRLCGFEIEKWREAGNPLVSRP